MNEYMKLIEIHNEILIYIAYKEGLMSKTDYIDYLKSQMIQIANTKGEKTLEQEPSGDLISRQSTLKPYEGLNDTDVIAVWLIRKNIEQQQSVEQEPKGHWIEDNQRDLRICSICGRALPLIPRKDYYCPNCGAKMVEPQESEE